VCKCFSLLQGRSKRAPNRSAESGPVKKRVVFARAQKKKREKKKKFRTHRERSNNWGNLGKLWKILATAITWSVQILKTLKETEKMGRKYPLDFNHANRKGKVICGNAGETQCPCRKECPCRRSCASKRKTRRQEKILQCRAISSQRGKFLGRKGVLVPGRGCDRSRQTKLCNKAFTEKTTCAKA